MKYTILKTLITVLLIILFLEGCHYVNGHDHTDALNSNDTASMAEEHHDDEVALTHEQIQKVGLKIGGFEHKNLHSTLKVNGRLELPPQNKAKVSSMISGSILEISVKPGQRISKGTILAIIQNPELINWQQEYLEVKGSLMFLDKEYTRQKELVDKEVAPIKQLEKISSDLIIARAKLSGLEARMRVVGMKVPDSETPDFKSTINIKSPINGYVKNININTGSYVHPEHEMFQIVDNHHLHIDFMVFEKDLPKIKIGQIIQSVVQGYPDKVIDAKIFAIGKALDETQKTIPLHAEILNKNNNLLPGMFVQGRILLKDTTVAVLPEEAIGIDNGLNYIFVKEEEHEDEIHFKKIQVLKIASDMGYVQIDPLEKISQDDKIVTEGAFFLMAQSKKGEESAGHHH